MLAYVAVPDKEELEKVIILLLLSRFGGIVVIVVVVTGCIGTIDNAVLSCCHNSLEPQIPLGILQARSS